MEFVTNSGYVIEVGNILISIAMAVCGLIFLNYLRNRQFDKCRHVIISALLTLVLIHVFLFLKVPTFTLYASLIAFVIGFIKELYDLIDGRRKFFDFGDLFANAIGIFSISLPYYFSF